MLTLTWALALAMLAMAPAAGGGDGDDTGEDGDGQVNDEPGAGDGCSQYSQRPRWQTKPHEPSL